MNTIKLFEFNKDFHRRWLRLLLTVLLGPCCLPALSQSAKVLVRNAPGSTRSNPGVEIKWYSDELIYPEGVNIYRKTQNDIQWVKLNAVPIEKLDQIDDRYKDGDLVFFEELANESQENPIDEDILLLNLWIKSFQNNPFAEFLGIYFKDITIEWGHNYLYQVRVIRNGQEQLLAQSDSIVIGPFNPADAPNNFSIAQDKQKLTINWDIDDEVFYAVNLYQWAAESGVKKLNSQPLMLSQVEDSLGNMDYPNPKFEIEDLIEGQTYDFFALGLGYFGDYTKSSDTLSITIQDATPPIAPTVFEVTQDTMQVILKWESPEDPDRVGTKVYRSTKSEGPYNCIHTTLSKRYTDSIEIPGPYFYYVSNVDSTGNESSSQVKYVEITDQEAPMTPEGLEIESDTGYFTLTWNSGTDKDLQGYFIFRVVDKSKVENEVLISSEPLSDTVFIQKFPKNVSNRFLFRIVAVDSSGNRSKPSNWVSGVLPDATKPERPFIKSVKDREDGVAISWIKNVDNDLMGYNIYKSNSILDSARKINRGIISPLAFRYIDREFEKGGKSVYWVQAVDSSGNLSEFSNPVIRDQPSINVDFGMELKIDYRKARNHLELSWLIPEGNVRGFIVYRTIGAAELKPYSQLLTTNYYKDIPDSETIEYQVRAFYENGEVIKSLIEKWKK